MEQARILRFGVAHCNARKRKLRFQAGLKCAQTFLISGSADSGSAVRRRLAVHPDRTSAAAGPAVADRGSGRASDRPAGHLGRLAGLVRPRRLPFRPNDDQPAAVRTSPCLLLSPSRPRLPSAFWSGIAGMASAPGHSPGGMFGGGSRRHRTLPARKSGTKSPRKR